MSNLNYHVTERQVMDSLRSILRLSGVTPTAVRLFKDRISPGRNRDIGVLEFKDSVSAISALSSINGKPVLGRALRVRRDVPAAKRRRTDEAESAAATAATSVPSLQSTVPGTTPSTSTTTTAAVVNATPDSSQPPVSPQLANSPDSVVVPTSVCMAGGFKPPAMQTLVDADTR
ncbi:hypothetical protein FOZ63_028879 [Perkinsus olseni]|uniref:RRM domain-containing protein n=1 Tax=Perkinsus olseni TaxID=32597 RepID=A0A7J6SXW6_PEROL|nr:hypothetical protein FOZ63_028879 [Perkinsus olseni]KAF4741975.1 hypothetical protein FOZ62_025028 [Perkinsus olseni]